jgi:DNA-binding transcriptional regulator PaaX
MLIDSGEVLTEDEIKAKLLEIHTPPYDISKAVHVGLCRMVKQGKIVKVKKGVYTCI